MASKIDLISSALILIGDTPINSLSGGGRREQVASNIYSNIVKFELSKFRWGFARRKANLNLLVDKPLDEWNSAYQMPSDLLTLIKLSPNVRYQIYGDKVYSNINGKLVIDYIADVPESKWPVYFSKMIEYALARDFATAIRDSSTVADRMGQEYVNASRMARAADSQQRPQQPIISNPFVDVRF